MLDLGECPIGNVRIDRDLRRRRDDNGNGGAGDRANVGCHGGPRHVDVGNVDNIEYLNLRGAGNLRSVGNVRLGLQQHYVFFDANLDIPGNARRRGSNRTSVGIHRDQQSWHQLRGGGPYPQRTADCGTRSDGANHTDRYISVRCFIPNDEPLSMPNDGAHRIERYRLLKQFFVRELDRT
jgi:hypothetical protein